MLIFLAALNLGNALGAWAGGSLIAAGLGYTAPIWAGAGAALVAFIVMALAAAAVRRQPATSVLIAPAAGQQGDDESDDDAGRNIEDRSMLARTAPGRNEQIKVEVVHGKMAR